MADLDKNTFVGTYNTQFADNTSNDIIAQFLRDFSQDIADSFTQTKYDTPSIGGSTYTLNFGDRQRGIFILPSRAAATIVALSNAANAKELFIILTVSNVAATYEFQSAFVMSDVRWDSGTNIITFVETGKYKGHAIYDGTNWVLEISQSVFV